MKITKSINFENFNKKTKSASVKKKLKIILKEKNQIFDSLGSKYKYSYSKKFTNKLKKKITNFRIIGIGGSILGFKAIYNFLYYKIKRKVEFVDNLKTNFTNNFKNKKNFNLVISKSGNTLETLTNANLLLNKKDCNVFVTQRNPSYLRSLAEKMKAEIIDHNNFIGGRYSVLSEVGMLPASLVGLQEKKFKQLNYLIKNKNFINALIKNVSNILFFIKKKKFNSVIINFDENSNDFFKWYKQLIAESLGKKQKGIFPLISTMPKDNHSLMQLYLDGPKKNFYTFFSVSDKNSIKLKSSELLQSHLFLKNKSLNDILRSQKKATENIFMKKKIDFRSFEILKRDEESLGELFCFFILETILLGRMLNVNPFDQPSVELIKSETKKILI